MQQVIDVKINYPFSVADITRILKQLIINPNDDGIANYRRVFGLGWAASMGTSIEELEKQAETLSDEAFTTLLHKLAEGVSISTDQFASDLDAAGIEWALVREDSIEDTVDRISRIPGKLKGIAMPDPNGGDRAIEKLEEAVREHDFVAAYASPFKFNIRADDPLFFPIYAKAVELDLPVFLYTAMNYNTDLPMDIGRPLYLDNVARSFPQLKIIASCGGWPWVPELIGVARRHRNVYIDTASVRPKYLGLAGSGYDMLVQFGNTLLQDQMVFASGESTMGVAIDRIVEEMNGLPLKESVRNKWMYSNALELFKLG